MLKQAKEKAGIKNLFKFKRDIGNKKTLWMVGYPICLDMNELYEMLWSSKGVK